MALTRELCAKRVLVKPQVFHSVNLEEIQQVLQSQDKLSRNMIVDIDTVKAANDVEVEANAVPFEDLGYGSDIVSLLFKKAPSSQPNPWGRVSSHCMKLMQ